MSQPHDSLPQHVHGDSRADVGVFGGSGFYDFLDDADEVVLATPYGEPSAPVTVGTLAGRRVAFLPRHGRRHEYPAHVIPYRANLWAMHLLGVRALLGPCAAGSLQDHVKPGDFVVCDQLVDRTWGRPSTYFDGPDTYHLSFADPYDAGLRSAVVEAARSLGITVHDRGTMVVIQGPRFSTRAESASYRREGWEVINMTGCPEAALAAELGIPYATVALITDKDAGEEPGEDGGGVDAVHQDEVFAQLAANAARVRDLLAEVVPLLPLRR